MFLRILMAYVFGGHDRMKDHERRIGFVARSGLPVLIQGECGTGKEALAELIHGLSGTGDRFTRVLCRQSGVVSPLDGGNSNGTGELSRIYEQARGTIFLKNVHVLPPSAQEQFLTTLEQRAEGDSRPEPRLISSATESAEGLAGWREFNGALYYRLSVYRIVLPPLRERLGDIPELFSAMVRRAANGGVEPRASARMLDALMSYDWPGNLRELQNIARAFVVMADPEEIIAELKSRAHLEPPLVEARTGGLSLKEQVKGASQKLESEIILRALEHHRWNRRRAAQTLKISYRSLLYKMKSCNLRIEPQTTREGMK